MFILCCDTWTILSSIGSILSGIFTVLLFGVGFSQIKKYIRLGELDLYYKLKNDYNSKENRELINSIIKGKVKCKTDVDGLPILYEVVIDIHYHSDIEYQFEGDLLDVFEDMFMFYRKGLIKKHSIIQGYGVIITKTFKNEEIKNYIKQSKIFYKDKEVYDGLKKLYDLIME